MNTEDLKQPIMDAIRQGRVQMRPRRQFLLYSAMGIIGSLIVLLTIVYVASLAVFFMRKSGAYFAPSFGMRGWFVLLGELPKTLLILVLVFSLMLIVLVRRYRFAYRRPLVVPLVGVVAVVTLGSYAISLTPLHRGLYFEARHGHLPPPIEMMYGPNLRPPHGGEVHHGRVIQTSSSSFVFADVDDDSTTTVYITPQTRLPYGADFSPGDFVVIIGDDVGTATIRAFGIREVGE